MTFSKVVGDLQLGDNMVTLNHLVVKNIDDMSSHCEPDFWQTPRYRYTRI